MNKEPFRKELTDFLPYVPGKPIEEVKREYGLTSIEKLASNENPLGPSPMAVKAVVEAANDINRYPESTAVDLKNELARHLSVSTDNLVIGNGGEELLSIIAQTFINEGDEVITAHPSFGIYSTTAGLMGAKVKAVPLKDGKYDLAEMVLEITEKTKLIYICNPNNPTGNIITANELTSFLDEIPPWPVVILDEAYFEYASISSDYPNGIEYLPVRDNIVVLRTFSKVSGIAGLRVGYLITSKSIATEMNKIKPAFNVSRLAQAAGRAALKDINHIQKTVDINRMSLNMMGKYFDKKSLHYFKSYANFIFVDVKHRSDFVFEELLKRGIVIRPGHFWGWDNWIRISSGTLEQTRKLIDCLEEVLNLNENRKH